MLTIEWNGRLCGLRKRGTHRLPVALARCCILHVHPRRRPAKPPRCVMSCSSFESAAASRADTSASKDRRLSISLSRSRRRSTAGIERWRRPFGAT